MDHTRKPLAVLGMAFQDYVFLERWIEYYTRQVGRENIYLLSHGPDARHDRIAKGANIIHLPRDETMFQFDRRRWMALSNFASGLLGFYNWVIVSDIDEFVLVDPDVSDNLVDYFTAKYPDLNAAPLHISPFALELVHKPEVEPQPIVKGKTILSRRRIYQPNPNYSKPCIVREAVRFTPGGHANTLGPRTLSDDLYLLHLRFFDEKHIRERLGLRADQIRNLDWLDQEARENHGWVKSLEQYNELAALPVGPVDISHSAYRGRLMNQRQRPGTNIYAWGLVAKKGLYQIPDRFADLV